MHNISNIYKYSLIVALSGWVLNFMAYSAGLHVMTEGNFFIGIFMGALTIYFTLRLRDENGGYFSFREAFKTLFTFGIIYGMGEAILSFVLYNFIDPELFGKMQEIMIWRIEDSLQKTKSAEQAKLLENLMKLLQEKTYSYEFWFVGLDMIFKCFKYGFYALFLAVGFKKQNPDIFA